jgi:hypothetical protein
MTRLAVVCIVTSLIVPSLAGCVPHDEYYDEGYVEPASSYDIRSVEGGYAPLEVAVGGTLRLYLTGPSGAVPGLDTRYAFTLQYGAFEIVGKNQDQLQVRALAAGPAKVSVTMGRPDGFVEITDSVVATAADGVAWSIAPGDTDPGFSPAIPHAFHVGSTVRVRAVPAAGAVALVDGSATIDDGSGPRDSWDGVIVVPRQAGPMQLTFDAGSIRDQREIMVVDRIDSILPIALDGISYEAANRHRACFETRLEGTFVAGAPLEFTVGGVAAYDHDARCVYFSSPGYRTVDIVARNGELTARHVVQIGY